MKESPFAHFAPKRLFIPRTHTQTGTYQIFGLQRLWCYVKHCKSLLLNKWKSSKVFKDAFQSEKIFLVWSLHVLMCWVFVRFGYSYFYFIKIYKFSPCSTFLKVIFSVIYFLSLWVSKVQEKKKTTMHRCNTPGSEKSCFFWPRSNRINPQKITPSHFDPKGSTRDKLNCAFGN